MLENLAIIGTIAFVHLLGAMSPGRTCHVGAQFPDLFAKDGDIHGCGFRAGRRGRSRCLLHSRIAVVTRDPSSSSARSSTWGRHICCTLGTVGRQPAARDGGGCGDEKERHLSLQGSPQGFFTNILNPKATLFFLGLFTVVISPAAPPPPPYSRHRGHVMVGTPCCVRFRGPFPQREAREVLF
jgi:hypothetical protein